MFKGLFGKKSNNTSVEEKIHSPVEGELVQIENVNDSVFSQKMLGDGIAIKPLVKKQIIIAPCSGVISTLQDSKHAVVITTNEGTEVLIHIGLDTVTLKGEGFDAFVKVGEKVNKGDKLIEADFSAISAKGLDLDVIIVFTNLSDDKKLVKSTAKQVVALDEIAIIVDSASNAQIPVKEKVVSAVNNNENKEVTSEAIVINLSGIHARPASLLLQEANKYKSDIKIQKGEKSGNLKSVMSILSLGLKYEDKVQITATGEDAQEAVSSIVKAFADGLGEGVDHIKSSSSTNNKPAQSKQSPSIDVDFSKEVELKGVVACPGLAIGYISFLTEEDIAVAETGGTPDKELQILEQALKKAKEDIENNIKVATSSKKVAQVEIFNAHLGMIQDPTLLDDAKKVIQQGKSGGFAWVKAIDNSCDALRATNNALLIERIADLKDLEKRVLRIILGIPAKNISFAPNTIIVAEDLVPSDIAKFEENVVGVALANGSSTSHISLMLRNAGIPTLVATGSAILSAKDKMSMVLDAMESKAIINISEDKLKSLQEKLAKLEEIKAKNRENAKLPAKTVDGHVIAIKGNISNGHQAYEAYDLGAEGIGLLRTEFLFFNSPKEPSEEEQLKLYQTTLDAMQGGYVVLRTLDVGGDKPLSYIDLGHEENPILGLRGVRNYFSNKDVVTRQIRAILKVKPAMLCKIMVPMVSEISEFIAFKDFVETEKKNLGITEKIEIGTMIEVPAAAIMAEQLAKYVDFFSIGTNDLTQYTLAMDRGNSILTSRLKNLNPAVLALIKSTVQGGNKYNRPTSICGAMASEILAVPILVGLGVTDLSVSMKSIPDVKALIRTLNYSQCKEIAEKALTLESPEAVEQLVKETFKL